MSRTGKVSLKAFWEAVEQRLAACSADELRAVLRNMAQETSPTARRTFLDRLQPVVYTAADVEAVLQQEDLVADIDDLAQELQAEMENAEYWEERYEWGEYDEEDSLGPYADFVEPLTDLFDRTETVFDYGNLRLARTAYEKLFAVLHLEDEYGRGVQAEDLENLDLGEARARYLRAVYETEPPARRPRALFEQMQQTQSLLSRLRPMLDDVIQISPQPLSDHDRFFADWIAFLCRQSGRTADALLREAIRLAQGTQGLEELARAEGKQRPRAYLDWFAALQQEDKHQEVLAAAQEALRALPGQLPIRAAVADYLCAAATRLHDTEALRAGRWEAFVAQPTLARLLDLWEATSAGDARTRRMQQAARHIQDYLDRPPGRAMEMEADDLESPAWIDRSVLAHARLLAEDWETAHRLVAAEQVLGWSSRSTSQGLVVACAGKSCSPSVSVLRHSTGVHSAVGRRVTS